MRRREFIAGLAGIAAWPHRVRAQTSPKVPVIGVLAWGASGLDPYVDLFRQGMREIGYVEGGNVILNVRFAEGSGQRAQAAMREFVQGKVAVIVASTTPSAHAAKSATAIIPIVMALVADAMATGLVTNLARPGGNITGVTAASPEVTAKTLEVLREIIPGVARVGFLGSTRDPNAITFQRATEVAAAGLGIKVHALMVRSPEDSMVLSPGWPRKARRHSSYSRSSPTRARRWASSRSATACRRPRPPSPREATAS
jgi:putative tryptophan/tyrosine transport system substrate-binding protein